MGTVLGCSRRGDGAGEGGGARRRLDGHGDRVVDEQGHGGHLGHLGPEVVAGHHVGAAGLRVELDHVEVRERHEEQHAEDGQRDGHDQAEGGQPHVRHQLGEHLLGAVGRRRDAVGRQHTEGDGPAQPLAAQLLGDQRRAEQLVLQPVAEGLGESSFDHWPPGDAAPAAAAGRRDRRRRPPGPDERVRHRSSAQ